MAKKGQVFNQYNIDDKLEVIKLKVEEGKAYSYLSKKYSISEGTIKTWVHQYRKGNDFTSPRGRRKKDDESSYKTKYEILKKYQAFLSQHHQEKKYHL